MTIKHESGGGENNYEKCKSIYCIIFYISLPRLEKIKWDIL